MRWFDGEQDGADRVAVRVLETHTHVPVRVFRLLRDFPCMDTIYF